MIAALVLGTVLAILALGYVLFPVFFPSQIVVPRGPASPRFNRGDVAVDALREIEFDRATGKLSDVDYASLRARYVDEAVVEMRRGAASVDGGPSDQDPVEAAVRAYRATHLTCVSCGIRPEPDSLYCSDCGRFLPARCGSCNAEVAASGARYCAECGHRLAA